jgi:hypothetical protein
MRQEPYRYANEMPCSIPCRWQIRLQKPDALTAEWPNIWKAYFTDDNPPDMKIIRKHVAYIRPCFQELCYMTIILVTPSVKSNVPQCANVYGSKTRHSKDQNRSAAPVQRMFTSVEKPTYSSDQRCFSAYMVSHHSRHQTDADLSISHPSLAFFCLHPLHDRRHLKLLQHTRKKSRYCDGHQYTGCGPTYRLLTL